ncbi:MAG: hypothetical protein ACK4SS_06185, partial [Cypionkella sp.]
MNKTMAAAAVLSAATFCLHVIDGGADVHTPIQTSDLEASLRAISAVIWHFVSLILLLQSVAFWVLTKRPNWELAWFLTAIQFGFGALFIYYGLTMLESIWTKPQRVVFNWIGVLSHLGQKNKG